MPLLIVVSQIDLVKRCVGNTGDDYSRRLAVHASNKALSSIGKAEANYESLIDAWDRCKNDDRVRKRQVLPPEGAVSPTK